MVGERRRFDGLEQNGGCHSLCVAVTTRPSVSRIRLIRFISWKRPGYRTKGVSLGQWRAVEHTYAYMAQRKGEGAPRKTTDRQILYSIPALFDDLLVRLNRTACCSDL